MQAILSRLMPFFIAGFLIVLAIIGIVVVSYILLWGALIGGVLYLCALIKQKLFPRDKTVANTSEAREKYQQGRIIDIDNKD